MYNIPLCSKVRKNPIGFREVNLCGGKGEVGRTSNLFGDRDLTMIMLHQGIFWKKYMNNLQFLFCKREISSVNSPPEYANNSPTPIILNIDRPRTILSMLNVDILA